MDDSGSVQGIDSLTASAARPIDRRVGIDRSIDALAEALAKAGVEPPRPPSESPDLDSVNAAIAPMSLPADVRRWWERVDAHSVRAWAYPALINCDLALDGWIQRRDEFPGMAPLSLFDVGYASHECMSVELDSPLGEGGALFEWNLVDGGFHLRYSGLSGWLERITELVAAGQFERRDGSRSGPRLHLRDEPEYGVPRYERDPLLWPVHWQRLSGIHPEDLTPRGATHTIAELLASDPSEPLEATVAARVVDLAGLSEITRVRVSDGTGTMAINCPTAVTTLGPVMTKEFEFDVIVPAGERRRPGDPDALEELEDPVADISQRLMARYGGPATAVATAVRPLEGPSRR